MSEPTEINTSVSPVYLGDTVRSTTVPLSHPFELAGEVYREVTVRRLRGFEAKQFVNACLAAGARGEIDPPFPGIELSPQAYAALDEDDVFAIDQAVEAFTPARFRALTALAEQAQGSDSSEPGDK